MQYHFAHDDPRPGQREFSDAVYETVQQRGSLFVHAPTGLGKTASVLSPAVSYAMRRGAKILFLTSRHTQHEIAIKTIRLLNRNANLQAEFGRHIKVADIIGKRNLCALELPNIFGSDFLALCKTLRDNDKCEFYSQTKRNGQFTDHAKSVVSEVDRMINQDAPHVRMLAKERGVCPYEIAMKRVEDADVIIADYNHIFHPRVREAFLRRADSKLSDLIVIADEAHNLPSRVRSMLGGRLSQFLVQRAQKEALEYRKEENPDETVSESMGKLDDLLVKFSGSFGAQDLVEQGAILNILEKSMEGYSDIDDFVSGLEAVAEFTRAQEKPSSCGTIASFITTWQVDREGLLRVVEREDRGYAFSIRTLDPAVIAGEVVNGCHAFIAVSGTLTPPEMFSRLLGANDARTLVLGSPFPEENRLDILLPAATTKYQERTPDTMKAYAESISNVLKEVPGNTIVFFPSYYLLDQIAGALETTYGKKLLVERRGMSAEEKKKLLALFRDSANPGAALFAVVAGSFGEGIDLPGDELRAVIVVGLPFEAPDLETKQLIDYYQHKFGKGWEYGYLYPAFNRIAQNAGRLIRTPTDRGVVIYIDTRYTWKRYRDILDQWSKTTVAMIGGSASIQYENMLKNFYASGS